MLEQLFNEQNQEQADMADSLIRNSKRRKTDPVAAHDGDDEDVLYYANVKGKRVKGGTGYDGDTTEDVCFTLSTLVQCSPRFFSPRLRDN